MKKEVNPMTEAVRIEKRIEIPSKIKYIKRISQEILAHLQRLKIDKSIQFDVRLAVEEAVRNAMEHGHSHGEDLPVTVLYTIDKDAIKIDVEDKGEGFDLKKVPDPRTGDNLLKGGGRGVFLIHKLMDKVVYNKKGNKVTMTKLFKLQAGGHNAG